METDDRPSASSAKGPCSPREKTVANAGNMLCSSNLFHSSVVLITCATKTKFSLSPGRTITWRMRFLPCWWPMGIAGRRTRTGPSHYGPIASTLVLSTAIVVPSLHSGLYQMNGGRVSLTLSKFTGHPREGASAGEREHKGVGVKERRPSMCPMASGLELAP